MHVDDKFVYLWKEIEKRLSNLKSTFPLSPASLPWFCVQLDLFTYCNIPRSLYYRDPWTTTIWNQHQDKAWLEQSVILHLYWIAVALQVNLVDEGWILIHWPRDWCCWGLVNWTRHQCCGCYHHHLKPGHCPLSQYAGLLSSAFLQPWVRRGNLVWKGKPQIEWIWHWNSE